MWGRKKSNILVELLGRAENLAKGNGIPAVSTETFIAASLGFFKNDMPDGNFVVNAQDVEEYRAARALLIEKTGKYADVASKLLEEAKREPRGVFGFVGISFQRSLKQAELQAEETSQEVRSDALLKIIFDSPTDAMKKILSEPAAATQDSKLPSQEALLSALDQMLREKKSGESGHAPSPVEKHTEEPETAPAQNQGTGPSQVHTQVEVPVETASKTEHKKEDVSALIEKVKRTQSVLLDTVFGQEHAVDVFTSGYFQAELLSLTDKTFKKPRATFLFAGPPGVGKTFLAEKAAEILELPFMRFDMSEYSDKEANLEFCGSDKVYKNGSPGNVTKFVSDNPKCVLLFDEIEKAHMNIIYLFLQMLDAGRLRDNYTDEEVSFKDAIIIFTTNAGKKLYEESDSRDLSGISRKVILKALENDINPQTGIPFFPAAMCSRFATGNVVMFNHMEAHNLRGIGKREIIRRARDIEESLKIKTEFDEQVFDTLIFSEGGNADARTIRSRAGAMFDNEIFELFRMIESEKSGKSIVDVETIRFSLDIPEDKPEIMGLYRDESKPNILLFSSEEVNVALESDSYNLLHVEDIAEACRILGETDIKLILCDATYKCNENCKYLNIEDVDSLGRDFLRTVREQFAEIPVYVVQSSEYHFSEEERMSYLSDGVRGILPIEGRDGELVFEMLIKICANIHQQQSMLNLARANKIIAYDAAQTISEDGRCAEIKMFDLRLETAVDAEDAKNILSNISKPNVKFEDVIGAEEAKKELKYFVEYLKNPKRFKSTGVRAPRGVLLYGPPGTGKTLLAKAMAGESDVTFMTAEGNQFLKKYVGEGPEAVHELFRTARKYAPTILFIDEIDAIAKERKGDRDSTEEILTAFLAEMDGFKNDPSKPVFVLAATNYDVEPGSARSLDPALMRRFDRRVLIDLPDKESRILYLKTKISGNKALRISGEMIENIAVRSTGMSLASLESVIELALRSAIRNGSDCVDDAVFEDAFETFNSGEVKKWDASQLERVARHEAGHAFLYWQSGECPSYVTIVARGDHGGYMQHDSNEGKAIYTKNEMLARIRTSLGGRAAELVYYGSDDGVSTGASGDLASATSNAMRMICELGMDENLGLAIIDRESARLGSASSDVRKAVNAILDSEMAKAMSIIVENRAAMDKIVEVLLDKNHLTGPEIDEIFKAYAVAQNS
ncbi:MAG: AAA family ATPase [Oscillospiraceae bacterium]|nr:AAA family ATPase [Oscillospiraceae bacterium]